MPAGGTEVRCTVTTRRLPYKNALKDREFNGPARSP